MTRLPSDPLACPYLITMYKRDKDERRICLTTHEACLIDDSELTRANCTRRTWLNLEAEREAQKLKAEIDRLNKRTT